MSKFIVSAKFREKGVSIWEGGPIATHVSQKNMKARGAKKEKKRKWRGKGMQEERKRNRKGTEEDRKRNETGKEEERKSKGEEAWFLIPERERKRKMKSKRKTKRKGKEKGLCGLGLLFEQMGIAEVLLIVPLTCTQLCIKQLQMWTLCTIIYRYRFFGRPYRYTVFGALSRYKGTFLHISPILEF